MAKIKIDGMVFNGETFEIKNGKIYIDDKPVYSFGDENKEIVVLEGNGNLYCDKMVVIEGDFNGSIIAEKVVINGNHSGEINSSKIINNND